MEQAKESLIYPGEPKGVPGTRTTPAFFNIKSVNSISLLRLLFFMASVTFGKA